MHIADQLQCTAEANTTQKSNYIPIKIESDKKEKTCTVLINHQSPQLFIQ